MRFFKNRFLIGAILILLVFGCVFAAPSNEDDDYLLFPTYIPSDVTAFCDALQMRDDVFCTGSVDQDPISLRSALERKFSAPENTYRHTAPLLNNFDSQSKCFDGTNPPIVSTWDVNNCPPPQACSGTTYCVFAMPSSMGALEIYFSSDGTLASYEFTLFTMSTPFD